MVANLVCQTVFLHERVGSGDETNLNSTQNSGTNTHDYIALSVIE